MAVFTKATNLDSFLAEMNARGNKPAAALALRAVNGDDDAQDWCWDQIERSAKIRREIETDARECSAMASIYA